MDIKVLTLEGCPNREPTRALVERVLAEEGITAYVRMVEISDLNTARACRFLGSPSLQVNGADIETARDDEANYAMACRIYRTPEGASGVPSEEMIRAALRAPQRPEGGFRRSERKEGA